MSGIRVFIADDHPVYREGLARHWSGSGAITVVGSTGDGAAVLRGILETTPDVAVVDLRLPAVDGLQILDQLGPTGSATRVMLLTAYVDSVTVYRAIAAGACGFLEKAASFEEITDAVTRIAAGETVIAPAVSGALAAEIRSRSEQERPPITERELAILRLAADGLPAQQIARDLHISIPTVKSHLAKIYVKLDVPDRASAVARAFRLGLLS
jgi:two-component system nitrate/nitrite response regulator NarL